MSDQERDKLLKNDEEDGAEDVEAHKLLKMPSESDEEAGSDDDVEAHKLY
jgi:hypothetical protein